MDSRYTVWVDSVRPAGEGLGSLLLAALPRALAGAALSLAVAVVLVGVLRKRGWLHRAHPRWSLLVKLHYAFWPIFLLGAGITLGATSGLHKEANRLIDEEIAPHLVQGLPSLRDLIVEHAPEGSLDERMTAEAMATSLLGHLYYAPSSEGRLARAWARGVNYLTLNFGKWVITAVAGALAVYAAGRTGDTLGLTPETIEFTLRTIKEMDLSRVDRNLYQIVLESLRHQVDGLFGTLYGNLLSLLTFGAALGVAEILVYRLWWLPRAGCAATGSAPPAPPGERG